MWQSKLASATMTERQPNASQVFADLTNFNFSPPKQSSLRPLNNANRTEIGENVLPLVKCAVRLDSLEKELQHSGVEAMNYLKVPSITSGADVVQYLNDVSQHVYQNLGM